MKYSRWICMPQRQQGAALFTALVILVLMTMLSITMLSTSTIEEKMSANSQQINRAFQVASSGLARVSADEDAYDASLNIENDGAVDDRYDKSVSDVIMPNSGYNGQAVLNSVFTGTTVPARGSGWDSTYAFYHFRLTSVGTINDGSAVRTLHRGAYQVGRAP